MVRITDIRKTKRGRYSLYIQEEFYGVLHPDIYYRFPYKAGEEISIPDLESYLYDSQILIAKERALRLLSARSYTAFGLKEKLLRDVDEEAAESVVARMEELGLIDDEDYAWRYAQDCVNLRGFSYHRTRLALAQRGIPSLIIEDTIARLGEEPSEELIYQQIKRRYLSRLGDEKGEQRTIHALQRRGFRYGDIRKVIDHLKEDPAYYEYDGWEE